MPRGEYAGQPLVFRCHQCKRCYDREQDPNCGTHLRTTGRIRRQAPGGANHHGWPHHAYQYVCKMCGHTGWSRHPSVQHVYREEHTKDITWERIKDLCKQGKYGKLDVRGEAICLDALKRDPEMYSKVKREADNEVMAEMRSLGGMG